MHGVDLDCSVTTREFSMPAIPLCLRVATSILEGPKTEVTPAVRKAVFEAISRGTRHHSMTYSGGALERAAEMIYAGMKDTNRGVRLSAGYVLVIKMTHERLTADVVVLLRSSSISTKSMRMDCLLVQSLYSRICYGYATLPIIGLPRLPSSAQGTLEGESYYFTDMSWHECYCRVTTSEVLYSVTSCLISYIGHANPIVRGNAYMQVCGTETAMHAVLSHSLAAIRTSEASP